MVRSRSSPQRAEHYRDQAAKLRELAETTPASKFRDQLLDLADQYDRLAAGVEESRI
jgi:hypothetical protein